MADEIQALKHEQEIEKKKKQELSRFSKEEVVHALPPIQSFWAQNFLRPKFNALGYSGFDDFKVRSILKARADCRADGELNIVSIGSGNCDTEVKLAKALISQGESDFHILCLDIADEMLHRGERMASEAGVSKHFGFEAADLNNHPWNHSREWHVAFANHSLHHIVNLEGLFEGVAKSLHEQGVFLISDMIGCNGHMSWPETLFYVETLWASIDREKKYHHVLKKFHDSFPNTDFSAVGFEGIRAQDILPLLLSRFKAEVFLSSMSVVRPFISRGYGPNYDVKNPADCAFIRFVANLDDALIDRGVTKPISCFATFKKVHVAKPLFYRHWSAEYCCRHGV